MVYFIDLILLCFPVYVFWQSLVLVETWCLCVKPRKFPKISVTVPLLILTLCGPERVLVVLGGGGGGGSCLDGVRRMECAWVPCWHISQTWVFNTDPRETCRYTFTAPSTFHSDDTRASHTSDTAVVHVCGRGTWFAYALAKSWTISHHRMSLSMAQCAPNSKYSLWSALV